MPITKLNKPRVPGAAPPADVNTFDQSVAAGAQKASGIGAPVRGFGLTSLVPRSVQGRVDEFGDWLGLGTRAAAGWLPTSVAGNWPGALTAGSADLLAQFFESSIDKGTPGRTAVEAGLGAIPLGKQLSMGRAIKSAGKSGTIAAVGDLGRQTAQGNFTTHIDPETGEAAPPRGWDATRTGISALVGALSGGILGKFFQGTPPPPGPVPTIIESSGAVPRGPVAPNGLSVKPPRSVQTGQPNFQERPVIEAGKIVPNATRTGEIHSLPYGRQPTPTTNPQPSTGRVAYGNQLPPEPPVKGMDPARVRAIEDGLDTQFQEAIRAKTARLDREEFDKLQNMFAAAMKSKAARVETLQRHEDDTAAALEAEALRLARVRHQEDALDTEFQDAIRSKNAAMDDEEAAQITMDIMKEDMEPAGRAIRETYTEAIPGGRRTAVQTYLPKAADDGAGEVSEITDNAGNVIPRPDTPEGGQLSAGGGRSGMDDLLPNLTDPVAVRVYDNLIKKGWTPRAAYRRAYEAQQFRENKAAGLLESQVVDNPPGGAPALQSLLTPKPVAKPLNPRSNEGQRVRQSAHPSFYDDGFDGLDTATPKGPQTPPKPGSPPPSAQAKLDKAEQTYAPEAMAELRRLSTIYNDPATPKAGRDEVGKQLRELTDFMEGRGRFAPKADGSKPDWVAEQLREVDKLNGAKPPKLSDETGKASVEQLLSMALGLGGGATGLALDAANDEGDSTLDGLAIGAGSGVAAALAPRLLEAIGQSNIDLSKADTIAKAAKAVYDKMPQLQRVSLLASKNLPANAWAGPQGSVIMRAIEDIFKGDDRGLVLLKMAYRPDKFIKGMVDSKDEALDALIKGEGNRVTGTGQGGALDPNSIFDKATAFPGWAMTAGDVHARKLMKLAGYTDDEAMRATLTSEPTEQFLRRQSDSAKGSWLGQMMFPFRRTLMNTIERGAERTPGIGFAMNKWTGRDIPVKEALVEQGLGLGMGAAGYGIASSIDDDNLRKNIRPYVSNAAGAYSLPSQVGWAIGDYKARGLDPLNAINQRAAEGMFPLPSTEVFTDAYSGLKKLIQGRADHPADLLPDSMNFRAVREFIAGPQSPHWLQKAMDTEPEARQSKGIRGLRPPRVRGQQ